MRITQPQAKEFLENITSEDKVVVVHDDDMDGMSSGILMYDFCINRGCSEVKHFAFSRGKSSLNDYDFSDCNKVIIVDLGPNLLDKDINALDGMEVFYTDHHPLYEEKFPDNVLEYRTIGKIPSSHTAYDLVGGKEWLAIAGTLSDAGDKYEENHDFLSGFIDKLDIKEEEFKEKYIWKFGSFLVYFASKFDEAFDILKDLKTFEEVLTLEKYWGAVDDEVKKIIEDYEKNVEKLGDANFYYFEPKFSIKSIVANKISFTKPKEMFFFAVPKGEKIAISARDQSETNDLAEILNVGIKGFDNAFAGGHPAASAGVLMKKDLEKFKENLRAHLQNGN